MGLQDTARTAAGANRKEEAMWLLEQLMPGTDVNNLPGLAVRLSGRLDMAKVAASNAAVLFRHPALRTVFRAGGDELAKEVLAVGDIVLPLEERDIAEEEVGAAVRELVSRPFTLDGSPLVRMAVFHAPEGDVLALGVHHLVFDSTSTTLFLEEFTIAYTLASAGHDLTKLGLEEVPPLKERAPGAESLAYWRTRLAGLDPRGGELAFGAGAAGSGTLAGAHVTRMLSESSAALVRDAQRTLKAQDAVALLAAYFVLLTRHGAGPDFAIGVPVNIRNPRSIRAIGYHVNILPVRAEADEKLTFPALTRAVRDSFLEAVEHADAPVETLMTDAPRIEGTWRSSLFRHVFNFLPGRGVRTFDLAGLTGEVEIVDTTTTKFDLEFVVSPLGEGFECKAVYSTDLFTAREAELLLERYDALLAAFAADLERPVAELTAWSGEQEPGVRRGRRGAEAAGGEADAETLAGLLELWRTLLGHDDVAADTNLFHAGGNSLLAAQLAQALQESSGLAVRLADVFENPTPAALAVRIGAIAAAAAASASASAES